MTKRMLIDASHAEEVRVAVVGDGRLEDFDFETATKKQIKGNIYLAKVTRVEPSLQAAFVEYGGNKQGFLPFSEIHFDYYQIPVADKEALIASMEQEALEAEEEHAPREGEEGNGGGDRHGGRHRRRRHRGERSAPFAAAAPDDRVAREDDGAEPSAAADAPASQDVQVTPAEEAPAQAEAAPEAKPKGRGRGRGRGKAAAAEEAAPVAEEAPAPTEDNVATADAAPAEEGAPEVRQPEERGHGSETQEKEEGVETMGNETMEDIPVRRSNAYRRYKIQEVIKRGQILLVQVIKEERGNKGASLTTYISLAGRYCVFMPNTSRQGGVSRRIASSDDRRRLKSLIEELEIKKGSSVIIRTAGLDRKKPEIARDYEYLTQTWDEIRELTVSSSAPALVYEEGDLIKRSLRDLYDSHLDEVLVEGEEAFKAAKKVMKMMMPSHVKNIIEYKESTPILHRYQIEGQLSELYSNSASLPSGGSIVINPTEALVSIDVNSGRATRERNIEETALKTNMEAAKEIARQLRLRDLAGLIVIDFIDMMELRNRRNVERALRDALASDRARIQVGRISTFGLLEMSRQRLRSSLVEASTVACPHCSGVGYVRSSESTAVMLLRALESEANRTERDELCLVVSSDMAFYMLNYKRDDVRTIEEESDIKIVIRGDHSIAGSDFRFDFNRPQPGRQQQERGGRRNRRRGGRDRDRNRGGFRGPENQTEGGESQADSSAPIREEENSAPANDDTGGAEESRSEPRHEGGHQDGGRSENRDRDGERNHRGGRDRNRRRGGRDRHRGDRNYQQGERHEGRQQHQPLPEGGNAEGGNEFRPRDAEPAYEPASETRAANDISHRESQVIPMDDKSKEDASMLRGLWKKITQ
jgi:ribonuclease E